MGGLIILIFILGNGAGSAEFSNLTACRIADAHLRAYYPNSYDGTCVYKRIVPPRARPWK